MFGTIVLQIVLIFLNAVFASAEMAIVSVSETKIQKLADEGNKSAKRILTLTAQPARFLSTIQVAITLAGFLGSAFAADNFAKPLVGVIMQTGIPLPEGVVNSICVVVITLILAYFTIVFGELIPKRIAMKKAESLALVLSGILRFFSTIFRPIVWLLTLSTNGVLKLFGFNPNEPDETVSSEEVMLLADAGEEQGFIDAQENQMIKNVFELKEQTVGEICTHRKEVDFLFEDESAEKWKERIYQTTHSFYPVCGKSVDDIIGLLNAKIYLRLEDKSKENVKQKALSPIVFISEQAMASEVFLKMQKCREYFAVVVDEYGGTLGIITLHDLIEELVGDLEEKNEKADYQITKLENGEWEIIGIVPMDEVEKALGITIEGEYETFGGYVCSFLNELPQDGETLRVKTPLFEVRVLQVKSHCICRAIVRVIDKEE